MQTLVKVLQLVLACIVNNLTFGCRAPIYQTGREHLPTQSNFRYICVLLMTVLTLSASIPKGSATEASSKPRQIAETLYKNWHCPYKSEIDLELTFKLTKDGEPFDINLTKGFENPYAIKASLCALLTAMPFSSASAEPTEITLATCKISGTSNNPDFKISLRNIPASPDEALKAMQEVPPEKPYVQAMFIGFMDKRLQDLCDCLFDYPDSDAIKQEITRLGSYIGLNCNTPHAWVCIGRSRRKDICMRNYNSWESENACRAMIAALFQAWRLSKDKELLSELEEACTRKLAVQIIDADKTNPLFLANAALLTNQFQIAALQYRRAALRGSGEARALLEQMNSPLNLADLRPIKLPAGIEALRGQNGWEPILHWLPTDIELLAVTKPKRETSLRQPKEETEEEEEEGSGDTDAPLNEEEESILKQLPKVWCGFTLHAARSFRRPAGNDVGSSDSAYIYVLNNESTPLSELQMKVWRRKCLRREAIEGIEVLAIGGKTIPDSVYEEKATYCCLPLPGIIVSTNDLHLLRQIIVRMRMSDASRAFPETIPEWKFVDTKSDFWAIRHYDRDYVPFDFHGMQDVVNGIRIAEWKGYHEQKESTSDRNSVTSKYERRMMDMGTVNEEIGMTFQASHDRLTVTGLSKSHVTLETLAKALNYVLTYNQRDER